LNGRIPVRNILVLCCVGTGLLYLPPIWARTEVQIVFLIALAGVLTGGIVTSSNSLVSMAVPVAQQGLAYGLSQSASSLGGGIGPFIGGGLAPLIGLRYTFAVATGVYVLVGILASRLIPERTVIKEAANAG
jgi:MFS family permease